MSKLFQKGDISIESQWRAIILFGKNSATYKFAFAKALLEFVEQERTSVSLDELSVPFANAIVEHLKKSEKQGSAGSSKFLHSCRAFIANQISEEQLYNQTKKFGFVNVVDAFQNVNGDIIHDRFYDKNYSRGKKEIVITDNLLKIKELFQFQNLEQEVEARWSLVETAWNLNINPNLLEVKYDESKSLFFLDHNIMRRQDITSVRDALNGYQKGKCFYSNLDISINKKGDNVCAVDHFFPHINKKVHAQNDANLDGIWNLVLADTKMNSEKSVRIPEIKFLDKLYLRNEFYIESKHPLAETIINQTGNTPKKRQSFLQKQYNLALSLSIQTWKPSID